MSQNSKSRPIKPSPRRPARKAKKIQQYYFESTMPGFIKQYFLAQSTPNPESQPQQEPTLGQLQNKLYSICNRNIKRLKFIKIFQHELNHQLDSLRRCLQDEPDCLDSLRDYCNICVYLWKIQSQIRNRERSLALLNQGQGMGKVVEEKEREEQQERRENQELNKYVWRFRIASEIALPGSSQTIMIDILREISDADRIPREFKQRLRGMLVYNDFQPIQKYMKIVGQSQQSETSTPVSHIFNPSSQTPQKHPFQDPKQKLPNTASKPEDNEEQMNRLMEVQKKIAKSRSYGLGRTLHFSHPIRFKKQPRDKVHYVNPREADYL